MSLGIKDLNKKMIRNIGGGGNTLDLLRMLDSRHLSKMIPSKIPNTMWDCQGPNSNCGACTAYAAVE